MENITKKLMKQNAAICMRCGSIYTGMTKEEYWTQDCDTCGKGKGWLNWVTGSFHVSFWGSPAAESIAKEFG